MQIEHEVKKKDTEAIYTTINEVCIRWIHENFYLVWWGEEKFSGRGIFSGGGMSKYNTGA